MALKLTKDEIKRKDDHVSELEKQKANMEMAIEIFNAAMETARVDLREAVGKYNEALDDARGFAEDIASRLENEIDDKSEKWQESDKGQAAMEFKIDWESVELQDNLDADEIAPGDIDFSELTFDDAENLGNMNVEPEE